MLIDLGNLTPQSQAEFIQASDRGVPGGVATLDPQDGKLSKKEMPVQTAVEVNYTAPANSIIGTPTNQQTALDLILQKLADHEAKVTLLTALSKTPAVQDAFNDVDLTRLNVHIPNLYKAQKWIEEVGIWTFNGNKIKSNGTVGSLVRIESTLSNCIVETDIVMADAAVPQAVVLRFDPTNKSHLRAGFVKSGGMNKFAIYEVEASANIRKSTPATVVFGQTYNFRVACVDNSITLYVNDQPQVSWSSTLNLTSSNHGLYCSSAPSSFDNFRVTAF